jgi:hypothetical protein
LGSGARVANSFRTAGERPALSDYVRTGIDSGPTHHDSDITADETWYPSGNPHIIDSTIDVDSNATLTIMPGCTVKFATGAELECGHASSGAIVAVGKPDSTILFTSNAPVPNEGDWQDVGICENTTPATHFEYCTFEYGGADTGYGEIFVQGSMVARIDHCKIWNSADYGIVFQGANDMLASFTNDSITTCARYPVWIYPADVPSIGSGNVLSGNTSNGVLVRGGTDVSGVTVSATWANLGVPYVISGDLEVSGPSGPTLTIAPGTRIELQSGVEFYCGYDNPGGIIADGAAGEIVFTSAAHSPAPGNWRDIGIYSQAESTVFCDCVFEYGGGASGYGELHLRNNNVAHIDHCRIWKSGDYGVVGNDANSGFASFTYNTVTKCARSPIAVYPRWVGVIGTENMLTGNAAGYDEILVEGGTDSSGVTASTTWLNQGVPYVLKGDVEVSGASGPTLTIAPGTTIKLQSGVELYCGYHNPGAIVADGASGQIVFTSALATPSPGDWKDIGFYDQSGDSCLLTHCKIEYGGGSGDDGDLYLRNTNKPDIVEDSISRSSDWGVYLDGSVFPDTIPLRLVNAFFDNALGDIYRPGSGILDRSPGTAIRKEKLATIWGSAVQIPAESSGERTSYVLLDASGREVLELRPGLNDVNRLAPGVYFVWSATTPSLPAMSETLHSTYKVVLTK